MTDPNRPEAVPADPTPEQDPAAPAEAAQVDSLAAEPPADAPAVPPVDPPVEQLPSADDPAAAPDDVPATLADEEPVAPDPAPAPPAEPEPEPETEVSEPEPEVPEPEVPEPEVPEPETQQPEQPQPEQPEPEQPEPEQQAQAEPERAEPAPEPELTPEPAPAPAPEPQPQPAPAPVGDVASVPADQPEPAPPAEGVPAVSVATRRRSRAWLPVAAVGVTVALLTAGTAALAWQVRQQAQAEAARDEAVAAARDAARLLFSYDHTSLEQDFAAGLAVTTGQFRDEYSRTTKQVVTPVAEQYDAVVQAEVIEAAVIDAQPASASVLVFLNQATTSTRVQGQQVDQSRVRMRLVERDGRWLVEAVDAL